MNAVTEVLNTAVEPDEINDLAWIWTGFGPSEGWNLGKSVGVALKVAEILAFSPPGPGPVPPYPY